MIVKVLKDEKNHLEIELNNLTMAELLRNCLWEDDSVKFSAWRREHPTKNPVLIVKTEGKTAKKAVADCIERIDKMADKIAEQFKKAKK